MWLARIGGNPPLPVLSRPNGRCRPLPNAEHPTGIPPVGRWPATLADPDLDPDAGTGRADGGRRVRCATRRGHGDADGLAIGVLLGAQPPLRRPYPRS